MRKVTTMEERKTLKKLERKIAKKRKQAFELYKDLWELQSQLAKRIGKKPTDATR